MYLKIKKFLLLYVLKKGDDLYELDRCKNYKEKIDDFFNSIDMDAVAKNVDAMLDQLDQEKCPNKR